MIIEYREPVNKAELDSVFRLRQAVYSQNNDLKTMVSRMVTHDINAFDIHALHFAAFDKGRPIACIRMVTNTQTHFSPWVKDIMTVHNIVLKSPETSFPFQGYYPYPDWCLGFISELKGKKFGEVGKLAIHKDYRKGGLVLNDLISSFVNYSKKDQKFNTGFGICTHELERYYRKFGFFVVEGSVPFVYDKLPEAVLVRFDD
jgi:Acetyltransferase (GNAT) domain